MTQSGAISAQEQARRARLAEQIRHSTEMEGGRTSNAVRAIQDRYVRGEIGPDELLQLSAEQGACEVAEMRATRGR